MNKEGKNQSSEGKKEPTKNNFKEKIIPFIKSIKLSTVLGVLLLIVVVWSFIKIRSDEKKFANEKTVLITRYETERDSLQIKSLEFASTVFSWSIRSELLRNNMENLSQLLTVFVQESEADLVQIVNPETKAVMLSSDKKYEGNEYSGEMNFELNEPVIIKEDQKVSILTPIMGFSSRIGVLIAEIGKE